MTAVQLIEILEAYVRAFGDKRVVVNVWDNRSVDGIVVADRCFILETEDSEEIKGQS